MKSLLVKLAVVLVTLGAIINNGLAKEITNVTPGELADALYYLLQKDMNGFLKRESFKGISKVINPEILEREMYFLKIFVIDRVIISSPQEELLKGMVRRSFLSKVSESNFYLQHRSEAYTIAFTNTSHHSRPHYMVITQFMVFCGHQHDAVIMLEVLGEFMGAFQMVNEVMKSLRIVASNP